MKQTVLLWLVVVFCGLIGGCATTAELATSVDPTPTKFEGAWHHSHSQAMNATYTFQGNQWEYTEDGIKPYGGVFTYTDEKITFIITRGRKGKWTQRYKLTDTVFYIEFRSRTVSHYWGPFVKVE
jgi:hypothetical protein